MLYLSPEERVSIQPWDIHRAYEELQQCVLDNEAREDAWWATCTEAEIAELEDQVSVELMELRAFSRNWDVRFDGAWLDYLRDEIRAKYAEVCV